MTHLFDTNAWIRALERPEELTVPASALLADSAVAPFALSAISIYEIGQKVRKGKLALSMPLERWFEVGLRPAFVRIFSVDAQIAREANELPRSFHGDPADRFIVATARRHNLTIITSDRKIRDYAGVPTLW